jgi:hypothetical protein
MRVYKVVENRMHTTEIEAREWLFWAKAGWSGCRKFAVSGRACELTRV